MKSFRTDTNCNRCKMAAIHTCTRGCPPNECVGEPTETFGVDATALQRVDGPVVVFESVHQLQDGAHAADGAVDGGGADELRGQVGVEGQLHLHSHVHADRSHMCRWRVRCARL